MSGSPPVRVCVVGCGAIGSLFAAHLARLPEAEVWAFDVAAEHVAAINENGLTLTGRADFTARVRARTDPGDIPPCDFGIVATKSEYTRAAMRSAVHVFADAAVASVQNGIGHEEIVAEFAPRVIRGTTLPAGAVTAPGVVRYDAPGGTWLGPFEPKPATLAEVEHLAGLLTKGGLPTHGMADARGAQWTKLIFNAATSPLGALTGLSIGPLCEQPDLRRLASVLIAEARAVADRLGIELDKDPEEMIDEAVADAYWHRASMLQDVKAQRRTEIDVLNGGVIATARTVDVPTPMHEAVVALIRGLESSWVRESNKQGAS